mgnify:CR=1 FL=1
MKKVILLIFMTVAAVATVRAQADDFPLQFVDAGGNVVPDGSVLNFYEIEEDDFGDQLMPTHLYVKNTSESDVQAGALYIILSLGSGAFQTCFPENCIQQRTTGSFQTPGGTIHAGELKDMQTEWLPGDVGQTVVTYQLITFRQNVITKKWITDRYGPKITLNFSNDPTIVRDIKTRNEKKNGDEVSFDLAGRLLPLRWEVGRRLLILRMTDGSVRKVMK